MTVDKATETFQAPNPTMEASEHLEVAGNRRQNIHHEPNLHLLSDSLLSEQEKLRHVLDWAHRFLSSGSEVYHELCSADGSLLAFEKDDKKRETEKRSSTYEHTSAAEFHHRVPSNCNEVFDGGSTGEVWQIKTTNCEKKKTALCGFRSPLQEDVHIPFCFTPERADDLHIFNQRHRTNGSDSSTNQKLANDELSHSEPEKATRRIGKVENPSFSRHLKIPSDLTVYEQYQLCVAQLHHLRMRKGPRIQPGGFTASPSKGRETSEGTAAPVEAPARPTSFPIFNSSSTNPEIKKHFNEARSKTAAEITEGSSSDDSYKNQDRSTNIRYRSTLPEHGETKYCDSLILKKNRPLCQNNTVSRTAGSTTSTHEDINTHVRNLRTAPADGPGAEENAAIVPNAGLKYHQRDVKGPKKTTGIRCLHRLSEKTSMSSSSLRNRGMLPRPQSAGASKHTKRPNAKRQTPEDRVTHTRLQLKETHTRHHDDTRPTSPVSLRVNNGDSSYSPAVVPVCDRWLSLPDEVWLSILSLLPHSYLCRVSQVCSRLRSLATDHTLWKHLRIENSALTERWLLFWGRRRPHSLCLYSCSGLSVTSGGLQMFFTLCRNYLEEVKVTNCTGPGLRGDQVLPLIGQLCDRVTSVDMSWSGATDKGVKALSNGCAGLRLKSIVLNGCHVTDDPLKKLVMRHKDSLCRLEVFGCQFLTPSCLQTIYETCHGLKHLNIGQVPKVNTESLTVMTSQLKSLISLDLTGLQAVTDATVGSLLQNCVKLQSLSLSSCSRVTDLTLHNISKYTPCIRSVDVSGCKAVTDAGVQSMTLGCRSLQQLDLSSTGTGNRGVTLLANQCSGHLQTVKLSFCDISSENILELCRCSKRLKVLHLYGCAHLPTEGEIRDVNTTVKVYPLP